MLEWLEIGKIRNSKDFFYIDYRDNGSVKKAIAKYHGKLFKGRNLFVMLSLTAEEGIQKTLKYRKMGTSPN